VGLRRSQQLPGDLHLREPGALDAGIPRSYTRRIGDPTIAYNYVQSALYFQDDIRLRRNLTMSGGVRYEAQMHVNDYDNIMPRVGITYAPGAQGVMTLRASFGIFHDWLSQNTYEQTLRVDGVHQKEVDVANPPFPDFNDALLFAAPGNRYVWGDDVAMSRTSRLSLGIDRKYKVIQASATYAYSRGGGIARGENLNTPVIGVRPDPNFGNVIEVVSDGNSRLHELQTNLTINQGALFPLNKTAPFISFKRSTIFLNYTLANNRNNSDGAFAVSPTGTLDTEWAPSNNDIRHRANLQYNNQIIKNLGVSLGFNVASASPYTLRTGLDDNRDLIYNDRPAGIGRNTERGDGSFNMNLNVNYGWTFGPARRRPAANWRLRRRRGRRTGSANLRSAGAVPDWRVPVRQQPHQPRQLCRLQRRHDLAVLPAGDLSHEHAPRRDGSQFRILTNTRTPSLPHQPGGTPARRASSWSVATACSACSTSATSALCSSVSRSDSV
jgi:hypothetical protein